MFSKSEVQWNHNTIYTNLWDDNTRVAIEESDQIAFKVSIDVRETLYSGSDIRDILNITFTQRSRFYNDRGYGQHKLKPLDFDF